MNADKDLRDLVHSYGQNKQLLLQAIKDLEIRIAIKTEQLKFDKRLLNRLSAALAVLNGASDKTGTSGS